MNCVLVFVDHTRLKVAESSFSTLKSSLVDRFLHYYSSFWLFCRFCYLFYFEVSVFPLLLVVRVIV